MKYNQAGISARSAKGWSFPLECEQCRFSARPVARVRDVSAQPGTLGMRHTKSTAKIKIFLFIYFYLYLLSLLLLLLLTSRISPKGWDCSESNFPLIKKKTEKLLKIAQALYSVYAEVFYLRSMSVAKMVIRHYPITRRAGCSGLSENVPIDVSIFTQRWYQALLRLICRPQHESPQAVKCPYQFLCNAQLKITFMCFYLDLWLCFSLWRVFTLLWASPTCNSIQITKMNTRFWITFWITFSPST